VFFTSDHSILFGLIGLLCTMNSLFLVFYFSKTILVDDCFSPLAIPTIQRDSR
jgi:hypothetical protein